MIEGVKCAPGNRVAQVYVMDFGNIRIYTLAHRREDHTSLSWYFMDAGLIEHLHSDNEWEITRSSKWKKVMDKEGGIQTSQK